SVDALESALNIGESLLSRSMRHAGPRSRRALAAQGARSLAGPSRRGARATLAVVTADEVRRTAPPGDRTRPTSRRRLKRSPRGAQPSRTGSKTQLRSPLARPDAERGSPRRLRVEAP